LTTTKALIERFIVPWWSHDLHDSELSQSVIHEHPTSIGIHVYVYSNPYHVPFPLGV